MSHPDEPQNAFYDALSERAPNFTLRNFRVHEFVLEAGLRPDARVLELGCGWGAQTELLAKFLKRGTVTAVDFSQRSLDRAAKRLRAFSNVTFRRLDLTRDSLEGSFNVVVLPDVLEHLPESSHAHLFEQVSTVLGPAGSVMVNIPSPFLQEFCRREKPELLQPTDLALSTSHLARLAESVGLYIHSCRFYEVWWTPCDYEFLVFRTIASQRRFRLLDHPRASLLERLRHRILRLRGR